jgi:hypothetical protein
MFIDYRQKFNGKEIKIVQQNRHACFLLSIDEETPIMLANKNAVISYLDKFTSIPVVGMLEKILALEDKNNGE